MTGSAGGDAPAALGPGPGLGLATLKIPVSSLSRALAFYEGALGWAPFFRSDAYGWAQLETGGPPLARYVPGQGGGAGHRMLARAGADLQHRPVRFVPQKPCKRLGHRRRVARGRGRDEPAVPDRLGAGTARRHIGRRRHAGRLSSWPARSP